MRAVKSNLLKRGFFCLLPSDAIAFSASSCRLFQMAAFQGLWDSAKRSKACHPPSADHETGCTSTTGSDKVGMYPYLTALQNCVCLLEKWHAKWSLSRKVYLAVVHLLVGVRLTATWKCLNALPGRPPACALGLPPCSGADHLWQEDAQDCQRQAGHSQPPPGDS